jgi:hypothetical protein
VQQARSWRRVKKDAGTKLFIQFEWPNEQEAEGKSSRKTNENYNRELMAYTYKTFVIPYHIAFSAFPEDYVFDGIIVVQVYWDNKWNTSRWGINTSNSYVSVGHKSIPFNSITGLGRYGKEDANTNTILAFIEKAEQNILAKVIETIGENTLAKWFSELVEEEDFYLKEEEELSRRYSQSLQWSSASQDNSVYWNQGAYGAIKATINWSSTKSETYPRNIVFHSTSGIIIDYNFKSIRVQRKPEWTLPLDDHIYDHEISEINREVWLTYDGNIEQEIQKVIAQITHDANEF